MYMFEALTQFCGGMYVTSESEVINYCVLQLDQRWDQFHSPVKFSGIFKMVAALSFER